jgi:hypothetical protein
LDGAARARVLKAKRATMMERMREFIMTERRRNNEKGEPAAREEGESRKQGVTDIAQAVATLVYL